jgi:fibronectin-binding autotransporter adhesin
MLCRALRSFAPCFTFLCALCLFTSQSPAATWTGSANNGLWNSGNNWDTTVPPAPGDFLSFGFSNAPLTLSNNVPVVDLPLSGIVFNAGASAFTINGNRITLNGDISNFETVNAQVINLSVVLGVSPNISVAPGGSLTLGGVISGVGQGFTKTDGGTLTLTGANAYSGPTNIGTTFGDGGTLVVGSGGTLGDGTSALTLGSSNTTVTGNLVLNDASATVGSLTVSSNTTTANTITIGAGRSLNVNGNTTIGGIPSQSAVANTLLQVTGGGTLNLGNGSGSLTINNFTPNNGSNATTASLDVSGVSKFVANYGSAGTITVGAFAGATATGPYGSLILGADNTLIAGTMQVGLNVGGPAGGRSGANRSNGFIKLGTSNKIFVDNITLGGGKTAAPAGTPIDSIIFNNTSAPGQTVQFRGSNGTSRVASIKVSDATLYDSNSGTVSLGTMDLTGGTVDALVDNLQLGLGKGNLNSAASTGTLTFNAGTFDVTTATLGVQGPNTTATATGNINVSGTGNLIVGSGNLTLGSKPAAGTSIITGNLNITNGGTVTTNGNIVSGGGVANLNLNSGTLNLQGHNIGTGATTVTFNAQAGTLSNAGQINGGAGLTKTTAGTLTLTGTNTYTGSTNINAGTLSVLSAVPGTTNVNSSGILAGTGNAGAVVLNGGGTIYPGTSVGDLATLSANSLAVNGGTLSFDLGAGLTSDLLNVIGAANFTSSSVINIATAAPTTGTYTIVTAGTLNLASLPSVVGPAGGFLYSLNTLDPTKLRINVTAAPVAITWNGSADQTTWAIGGATNWTNGSSNVAYSEPAIVTFNDAAPPTATNITLSTTVAPASITVNSDTNNYTIAGTGSIGGSAQIIKNGSSTLTLLTNNSYGGPTTLNAGTIQVGNGGTVGSLGTGPVTNNGIISVNRTNTTAIAGDMSGTGELQQNGTGTLILTGNNSYGTTTINAGTLQLGNGGATGTLGSGAVTNNGALVINRSGTMTVGNAISGPGTLTQLGSVATTLTGDNSYSGGTTISGGAVSVSNLTNTGLNSNVGTGGIVLDGGMLRWIRTGSQASDRTFSLTTNGGTIDSSPGAVGNVLTLSSALAYVGPDGSRTLTLTGTDLGPTNLQPSVFSGLLADPTGGALSIVKNGANGWTLNNPGNSFTGSVAVNAGQLRIAGVSPSDPTGQLGSNVAGSATNVTVANGAQIRFETPGIFNSNFSIAGNGLTVNEGFTTGALWFFSGATEIAGTVTLAGDARIGTRSNNSGATISGKITGAHALEIGKNGNAGTLVLSNTSNDWTGGTTIGTGTTRVGAASTPTGGVIPHGAAAGNVLIFGGDTPTTNTASTLDLNGFDTTVNGLSSGGTLLNGANSLVVVTNNAGPAILSVGDNNQSGNYGGTITGSISVNKIGTGTQTLSGNTSYFGTTTVSGGTLLVNGTTGFVDHNVATGGTLGGTGTINAPINVAVGGTLAPGTTTPGTLHAAGTVDLSGTLSTKLQANSASVLDATVGLNINTGTVANFELVGNITSTQFQFANHPGFIGGNGNGQFSSVTFSTAAGVPAPTLDHIEYGPTNISLFVTKQSLRGNFNLDNVVDANDIQAMLKALTNLPAYMNGGNPGGLSLSIADMNRLGDFNNSGTPTTLGVTNHDIQGLLSELATLGAGSMAAVPEPSSLALLGLGISGALFLRKKRGA